MSDQTRDVIDKMIEAWLEKASDYTRLRESMGSAALVLVEAMREDTEIIEDPALKATILQYLNSFAKEKLGD